MHHCLFFIRCYLVSFPHYPSSHKKTESTLFSQSLQHIRITVSSQTCATVQSEIPLQVQCHLSFDSAVMLCIPIGKLQFSWGVVQGSHYFHNSCKRYFDAFWLRGAQQKMLYQKWTGKSLLWAAAQVLSPSHSCCCAARLGLPGAPSSLHKVKSGALQRFYWRL